MKSHPQLFDRIADHYETTNHILSLGLYSLWNRKLCKMIIRNHPDAQNILDLCCGTGAIPKKLFMLSSHKKCSITLVDFSEKMLNHARETLTSCPWPCHYLLEDVSQVPLDNESFDVITCAYGVRNITRLREALDHCYRMLKPQSYFFILELTRPKNRIVRFFHKVYLKWYIPFMGSLLTSQKDAYSYLIDSIDQFMEPGILKRSLETAGFSDVQTIPLTFGLATIIVGKKQ